MKRRFLGAAVALLFVALAGCGAPDTSSSISTNLVAPAPETPISEALTIAPPTIAPIPVATATVRSTIVVKSAPSPTLEQAPVASESLEEIFPVQENSSPERRTNTRGSRQRSSQPSQSRASRIERESVANAGGQVWVNSNSDVYHMPGMRWYGKTKEGYFASESEAQAAGFRRATR